MHKDKCMGGRETKGGGGGVKDKEVLIYQNNADDLNTVGVQGSKVSVVSGHQE